MPATDVYHQREEIRFDEQALSTKSPTNLDLSRVLSRRDTLLKTLFDVTQSYLQITGSVPPSQQENDLHAFLEANDLHRWA